MVKYQLEHDVQNEIRIWCGEHNIKAWRINVAQGFTKLGYYFSTGVPEGFPDLEICPGNGQLIYCECKTLKGRQREKQIEFQRQAEADGYVYLMPRSLKQFIEQITPYIKEKLLMEQSLEKTVKDVIIERYGSINGFIATKIKEYGGELPVSREWIYKLINHEVANPGIKSLNVLADMVGIPREQIYKEYSE